MPSLIAIVWTTARPVMPRVWCCTRCSAVFDVGPMRPAKLAMNQIERINSEFKLHCKKVHRNEYEVIGLNLES